jgi:hypothetical protein
MTVQESVEKAFLVAGVLQSSSSGHSSLKNREDSKDL